jgi:hypothetical protein
MRALAPIIFTSLAVFGTGCAELRSEYTPSSGEPMSVYDHTVLRTGTQQVATGQDQVRDANGNIIATNTHYENQRIAWTERDWYPEQGGQRVDDESFFRIVNDKQNAEKYQTYHEAGKKKNTAGFILLGIGAALLGGGIGAYEVGKPSTNADGSVSGGGPLATVGYVGMTAGLVSAGLGAYLVFAGKREAATKDARIINEPDRFKFDAKRYNETLSGRSEVGLSSAPAAALAPAPAPAASKGLSPATSTADQIADRLRSAGWTITSTVADPSNRNITVGATKGTAHAVVTVTTSMFANGARKSGHAVSDEDGGFVFDVRCRNAKEHQDEILGLLVGK